MFIQTEDTPNPSVMKFVPGELLLEKGTYSFGTPEEAKISPLATRLFALNGVEGVFLGADFLSVTKQEQKDWMVLKPLILGAIMDHLVAKLPIIIKNVSEDARVSHSENGETEGDEDEIVAQIKELLDTRIRPAVAMDGGDIVFVKFEDGIVYLTLHGACSGCPSSSVTLKSGIENMLKHYVPEVESVQEMSVTAD